MLVRMFGLVTSGNIGCHPPPKEPTSYLDEKLAKNTVVDALRERLVKDSLLFVNKNTR